MKGNRLSFASLNISDRKNIYLLSEYVSAETASNNISQMRHIVDVGQCRGDQYVFAVFFGKT